MRQLKILNAKERKELAGILEGEYEADLHAILLYQILKGESEYFIVTRECLEQNLEGFSVDSFGMRLATEDRGKIKPTIHAVQMFYQKAGKKMELDEQQARKFIKNEETPAGKPDGRYIITHKNKPIDTGQVRDKHLKRN